MNVRSARPTSHRRYRRRILGWGAVGVAGVFAIGGPVFVNRVEDDLERRSTVVLEAAGVGGVTTSFSGQDGELRCLDGMVDIPDDVLVSIRALWGVSSLDVAGSCTDGTGDPTDTGEEADGEAAPTSEVPTSTDAASANSAQTTVSDSSESMPDPGPVTTVVANDSQFSTLAGLLADADLTETLAGDGPFTLFAPTNAAFEALGADVTGALARDPESLALVLSHHVADGSLASTDLSADTIEMLDGTAVTVGVANGVTLTSGNSVAVVTEPDLDASNGVVHAIDQVLIPDGMVIGLDPASALAGAEFVDGQIVLGGTVATEAQREALVAAAQAGFDPANVIDELVVAAAADTDDASIDALATVITAMPSHLVTGTAQLKGEGLSVEGIYADAGALDAFNAAIGNISSPAVTTTLTERTAADANAAAQLEADLNALVTANPILFDPSSTSISAASAATLDRVAAFAKRVGNVDIEIQGYTDTDGVAASNQALSDGRARSVRDALVERGIATETLSIVGLGGTKPILGADGQEDKAASRRVEFVVTATQ